MVPSSLSSLLTNNNNNRLEIAMVGYASPLVITGQRNYYTHNTNFLTLNGNVGQFHCWHHYFLLLKVPTVHKSTIHHSNCQYFIIPQLCTEPRTIRIIFLIVVPQLCTFLQFPIQTGLWNLLLGLNKTKEQVN